MSVERTHVGHRTRYELRDEAELTCMLTYAADPPSMRHAAASRLEATQPRSHDPAIVGTDSVKPR